MSTDRHPPSPIPTPTGTRSVGQLVEPIVRSSNAFMVELWKQVQQTVQGNLALSPASITTAMAMTWAGARGETAAEMKRTLHFEGSEEQVLSSASLLLQTWEANRGPVVLRVANRLFGEENFTFEVPFLELTRKRFGAPLEPVSFTKQAAAARARINEWIAKQTEDRIKNLVPENAVDSSTLLVLVNAIYFQGDWLFPFKPAHTRPEPFFTTRKASKKVSMMSSMGFHRFAALDGVKLLELPYEGNDMAMVFVLPDEVEGLEALEQGLTGARVDRWIDSLKDEITKVSLPRFDIDPPDALRLGQVLKGMGMGRAFDPSGADFSGIAGASKTEGNLYISEIFHKAFVKLNERGTEAAAGSTVMMTRESADLIEEGTYPKEFRANHPFLILLRDKRSGMILFMGRVTEPQLALEPRKAPPPKKAPEKLRVGQAPEQEPRPFGKYELLRKLSTNDTAAVWLARPRDGSRFARKLALKLFRRHLSEDEEFVKAMGQEALIVARFNHPNIVQVHDFGETDGTCYLAMEYVHGEALSQVLNTARDKGQWVARHLAFRIVANVCEGLYHAYTRKDDTGSALEVLHRDICPQNILISHEGTVKLVDFGVARALARSTSDAPSIGERFAYMASEKAAGKTLEHRTDVFGLGLVLYELLTGVQPFQRDSELATLQAALECKLAPPSEVADVPPEFDDLVMEALARSPEDRYRDARQFQRMLEQVIAEQGWVAGSMQLSDMMEALFPEALLQG